MRPVRTRACTLAGTLAATMAATLALRPPPAAHAQVPGWDRGLDAELDSIRKAWKIPGMAVAVVAKGKVLHLKGYGVRDLAAGTPVSPDTKFRIASLSKSFTVTTLAALAKDGRLGWEDRVRQHLPEFQAYDPWVTEHLSVRDLVTMRTGIARHDLLWGIDVFPREELVRRIRHIQPNQDFRTAWQYQNLMFTTAGYLAGRVDGGGWEALVRRRVLQPLGMTRASPVLADYEADDDFTRPYALHDDGVVRLVDRQRNTDPIAPTGGLHASLRDMTHYLTLHLQGGAFNGQELIRRADSRAMQSPQMAMSRGMAWEAGEFPELSDEGYGMGFLVTHYRGHKMVHHPGNWDGWSLELSFLPNDSLGVVVLTNMYSTTLRDFLPFLLYDRLLGLSNSRWSDRFLARAARARATQVTTRAREDSARIPGTAPAHTLDAYVGRYTHPAYGEAVVTRDATGLRLRFGNFEFPLAHYHYDSFRYEPPAGDPTYNRFRWRVSFVTGLSGRVETLLAPLEPAVPPLPFTRNTP
jgi:CubicO group peptidase (beta-lactamase class C family)